VSPEENRDLVRRKIRDAGLELATEVNALAVLLFTAELEEEGKWPQWLNR
jgi:hypothetical protein